MAKSVSRSVEFRVRDLMINVAPAASAGGGAVGLFEDTPPTPLTPITPVAAVAAYTPRLRLVDALVATKTLGKDVSVEREQFIGAQLDRVALDVGRAVIGSHLASKLGRAALCTQDMPTCDANQLISRFASEGLGVLRTADLALLKEQVQHSP